MAAYIETALILLGAKRHDGEERRCGLQDVMAGEVFGSGTQRYAELMLVSIMGRKWSQTVALPRLEHLQTDFRPLADRLQSDTTVD